MNALFVHDHRFQLDNTGRVFTPGQFPYATWLRYLEAFDLLTVVGRSEPMNARNSNALDLSSGERVRFVFAPNVSSLSGIIFDYRKAKCVIRREVERADAVIIRTSRLGGIAEKIANDLKKPLAVEVVGCSWDAFWNHGTVKGKLFAPWAYFSTRRMIGQATHAIYVSQQFLPTRYPCKGISVSVSDVSISKPDQTVIDRRIGENRESGSRFVVGTIGSLLTKYKGIQTALAAFKRIRDQLPEFEYRILGGGDSTPWKTLAKKYGLEGRVTFTGVLPAGSAVMNWLDDIDLYIQPSLTEGLPRALVEAMSRGCPAIGSTAGGIPELLESSVLHRPGSVEQLAKLIKAGLSKSWQKQQALRNFEVSKQYSREFLDSRRAEFWHLFANYARSRRDTNQAIVS